MSERAERCRQVRDGRVSIPPLPPERRNCNEQGSIHSGLDYICGAEPDSLLVVHAPGVLEPRPSIQHWQIVDEVIRVPALRTAALF
jgi:hypothetical protein